MKPAHVLLSMLLSGTAISTPSPTGATPCEPMSDIESSTSCPYLGANEECFKIERALCTAGCGPLPQEKLFCITSCITSSRRGCSRIGC
ncbi:hypothetical protein JMJ77_0007698 [Colletotrichum scovillei]|uniref:Uncharacterized protein n=1 Tax=Colletotrichum scovillei TaxID=1209932 RepID=A0A9P7RDC3_9PEZI|nr:hypothetical protein JMJ77_0007698 [Colletotrichum scovillei]KAG7074678.1 hypothetical protein JMJ76_0011152 [Colletotrichum scovillei]KAG7081866.1 hypothetical protein JMJ78_0003978 [Colletotrichum scovillei]